MFEIPGSFVANFSGHLFASNTSTAPLREEPMHGNERAKNNMNQGFFKLTVLVARPINYKAFECKAMLRLI